MRRRTKRDLGVLLGALAIIGTITFVNMQFIRGSLAQEMNEKRQGFEKARLEEDGIRYLDWRLIKATRGSLKNGGEYAQDLLAQENKVTYLIGYMVPEQQFRDVSEFLLLPIPIECYFCSMPPSRDVVLVKMAEGETTNFYDQFVLIKGVWNNMEGPSTKFFYSLEGAYVAPAEKGAELVKKRIKVEHMLPQHEKDPTMLLDPVEYERSTQ